MCVFQEHTCGYLRVNLKAFVITSEHTRLRAGGKAGRSEGREKRRGTAYPAP